MHWLLRNSLAGFLASSCLAASCWRNTSCTFPTEAAFHGLWDDNIYAPSTRNPRPKHIISLATGQKIGSFPGQATMRGNGSALIFDFGVEVGGVTSLKYTLTGDPVILGLAWTEAKDYVGYVSDSSNGNYRGPGGSLISQDGAWRTSVRAGSGTYKMPVERLRGGFRYLTVYILTNGTSAIDIEDVDLEIAFQPTWSNLRAYQGYFHSSDDELNKIWYSGAYTLQTNAVPPETGRVRTSAITRGGWLNNETVGVGMSVILDGAKRDRWIWPGDMGVAVSSAFYSTGDLESSRNSLQTLYNYQPSSGSLPSTGPPAVSPGGCTYHMWAMIGTYNYVLFSGDMDFLSRNWAGYVKAMDYIYGSVESDGILSCRGRGDWGRYVNVNNGSAPNMLLYRTLVTGAALAEYAPANPSNNSNLTAAWLSRAADLRTAVFKHLWDTDKGAFIDGWRNRTLYPQDGNSFALAFGVVEPGSAAAATVSQQLTTNWTPLGPASPELPGNVSPFISGLEVSAHFAAGRPDRAVRLLHDCWGWYLRHPNGTGSTVVEGYLTDGSWGYRATAGYGNDPAYVSHAHGWSSGPTSALTNDLVGLSVTRPAGAEWTLKPALGSAAEAQAGFTTTKGKFTAKYVVKEGLAVVEWDTPQGTRGWVDLGSEKRWVDGGKMTMTVKVAGSFA